MNKLILIGLATLLAGDVFSETLAQLERTPLTARLLTKGVTLFRDRAFVLKECPAALEGVPFLVGPFADAPSVRAKILVDGEIRVISPQKKTSNVSQEKILREQGFELDATIPVFQAWGELGVDRVSVWKKNAKKGDEIVFGKWAIVCGFDTANVSVEKTSARARALQKRLQRTLNEKEVSDVMVTKPDFAVFIPPEPRNRGARVKAGTHDTYNDHFQVIRDSKRNRLYAFWTQATQEPMPDHHTAFRVSKDNGITWSETRVLNGNMTTNKEDVVKGASWQQPMLAKTGRLYCLWSHGKDHSMHGIYSDDGGETWSKEEVVPVDLRTPREVKENAWRAEWWCNWQRPLRLGENGNFLVGSSRGRDGVEFWEFTNIDENPEIKDIKIARYATGDKALKVPPDEKGKAICEEPAIMKLPDGRLFAVMRASGGAAVWSQSRDKGKTWTQPEQLRTKDGGELIKHSVSPAPVYDWKGPEVGSGMYFGCFHLEVTNHRGPLFLVPGFYNAKAHQPVEFTGRPKLIVPRSHWNSMYASYTEFEDGGILWYNDAAKFYLLGKVIDEEWMKK